MDKNRYIDVDINIDKDRTSKANVGQVGGFTMVA